MNQAQSQSESKIGTAVTEVAREKFRHSFRAIRMLTHAQLKGSANVGPNVTMYAYFILQYRTQIHMLVHLIDQRNAQHNIRHSCHAIIIKAMTNIGANR